MKVILKKKALDYQKETSMAPDRVRRKWYSILRIYEDIDTSGIPEYVELIDSFLDGKIDKVNKDQLINAWGNVEGELREYYQPDTSYDPEDRRWIQHDRFQDDMYIVESYIHSALKNKASDSTGSFYINGKLVASARYEKDSYIFFDVNGNVVSKIKSEELSLSKDRAKAWEKLSSTFGDYRGATSQPTQPTNTTSKISKTKDKALDNNSKNESLGKIVFENYKNGRINDRELEVIVGNMLLDVGNAMEDILGETNEDGEYVESPLSELDDYDKKQYNSLQKDYDQIEKLYNGESIDDNVFIDLITRYGEASTVNSMLNKAKK